MLTALFTLIASAQICIGCPTGPPPVKTQISDGDWSVQIVIEAGVEKSEAEQIVRAFHRGELVDKHPRFPGDLPTASYVPPPARANTVGRIAVSSLKQFNLPEAPGRFLVVTTYGADGLSGYEYLIAIRDGRVELLASLMWIV